MRGFRELSFGARQRFRVHRLPLVQRERLEILECQERVETASNHRGKITESVWCGGGEAHSIQFSDKAEGRGERGIGREGGDETSHA